MFGGIQLRGLPEYEISSEYFYDELSSIGKNTSIFKMLLRHHLELSLTNLEKLTNTSDIVKFNNLPPFPTLNPRYCRIIWGERKFSSPIDANIALFDELLRVNKFRKYERQFGFAGLHPHDKESLEEFKQQKQWRDFNKLKEEAPSRLMSPLIAQVRYIGGNWYPILTMFQTDTKISSELKVDWGIANDFMDTAETVFNGTTVWGRRFKS
jgi:hypothetical protein